jgi:hypothetical protein
MAKGGRGVTFGLTNSRGSSGEFQMELGYPVALTKGKPMTEMNQEVATPWKAGCGESRTPGLEEGVGKRPKGNAPCAYPTRPNRTSSTEAEIRRQYAFEAPKEIDSGRFLPSGTPDSAGVIPFLTSR